MIGVIYEITNADRSIVYIGSTTQSIESRWNHHMNSYKSWIEGKTRCGAAIYHHFKKYGIDSFDIDAISAHEVESRSELFQFEQLVIDKTKNTCNKHKAFYDDSGMPYNKYYYEKNKDKINMKIECGCGGRYTHKNKYVHVKTKIHQTWVSQAQ